MVGWNNILGYSSDIRQRVVVVESSWRRKTFNRSLQHEIRHSISQNKIRQKRRTLNSQQHFHNEHVLRLAVKQKPHQESSRVNISRNERLHCEQEMGSHYFTLLALETTDSHRTGLKRESSWCMKNHTRTFLHWVSESNSLLHRWNGMTVGNLQFM